MRHLLPWVQHCFAGPWPLSYEDLEDFAWRWSEIDDDWEDLALDILPEPLRPRQELCMALRLNFRGLSNPIPPLDPGIRRCWPPPPTCWPRKVYTASASCVKPGPYEGQNL